MNKRYDQEAAVAICYPLSAVGCRLSAYRCRSSRLQLVIQGRLTSSKEPFPPPAEQFPNKLTPLSSGLRPAPFRSDKQKEGPFMGRLRANFARLGNPMQDCHLRKEPTLRNLLLCLQGRMTESQSPLPKEGGGAVRRRRIGASVLSDIFGAYHQDFNQLFSEEGALQFVMRRSANPQSPVPSPQSPVPSPQSPIPNPLSPIPNPQSPILIPLFPCPTNPPLDRGPQGGVVL
jgi:hypothetical protein